MEKIFHWRKKELYKKKSKNSKNTKLLSKSEPVDNHWHQYLKYATGNQWIYSEMQLKKLMKRVTLT